MRLNTAVAARLVEDVLASQQNKELDHAVGDAHWIRSMEEKMTTMWKNQLELTVLSMAILLKTLDVRANVIEQIFNSARTYPICTCKHFPEDHEVDDEELAECTKCKCTRYEIATGA